MIAQIVFGSGIIVLAMFLTRFTQLHGLPAEGDAEEVAYRRARHSRRQFVNGLLLVIGIAVAAGVWIPKGIGNLVYWLIVALLVLWILILAFIDALHTRRHYVRQLNRQRAERQRFLNDAE